jgi:hypothetical protein
MGLLKNHGAISTSLHLLKGSNAHYVDQGRWMLVCPVGELYGALCVRSDPVKKQRLIRCVPSLIPISGVGVKQNTTVCENGGHHGGDKSEKSGGGEHLP